VKPYLGLSLDETVVGQATWKLPAYVIAYVAEIERFEVAVAYGMEEYKDGHNLAVGYATRTVAAAFTTGVQRVFFQFEGEIFAEFIVNTENFY